MSGNTTDKISLPKVKSPRVKVKSLDDLIPLLKQSRIESANDPNLPEAERQRYREAIGARPWISRPE